MRTKKATGEIWKRPKVYRNLKSTVSTLFENELSTPSTQP